MTDPFTELVRHLNSHLRALDPQLQIGVEMAVGVTLTFRTYEHDTFLRVLITDDGWELVDPKEQARRIEQEIFNDLTQPKEEAQQ